MMDECTSVPTFDVLQADNAAEYGGSGLGLPTAQLPSIIMMK